jgi:hypothetical protein
MSIFTSNYLYDLPTDLINHIFNFLSKYNERYVANKMLFIKNKRIENFLNPFGKCTETSYMSIPKKYHTPLVKSWLDRDNNFFCNSYCYDHYRWYKLDCGWLCINSPYNDAKGHQKLINEGWTYTPLKLYNKYANSYYIFIKGNIKKDKWEKYRPKK